MLCRGWRGGPQHVSAGGQATAHVGTTAAPVDHLRVLLFSNRQALVHGKPSGRLASPCGDLPQDQGICQGVGPHKELWPGQAASHVAEFPARGEPCPQIIMSLPVVTCLCSPDALIISERIDNRSLTHGPITWALAPQAHGWGPSVVKVILFYRKCTNHVRFHPQGLFFTRQHCTFSSCMLRYSSIS